MNRTLILLPLVLILHFFQLYTAFNPQLINCFLIPLSGMNKAADNIYLSADLSPEETSEILDLVEKARVNNRIFWGDLRSEPVIIICKNDRDFIHFGDYKAEGVSRLYTAGSYVVIGPTGLSEDVVTHELCHAELFERVGYRNDEKIPVWFHEGLAMVASNEFQSEYSEFLKVRSLDVLESKLKIDLNSFETGRGTYNRLRSLKYFYLKAGLEVNKWLEVKGKEGLNEFVEKLNSGKSFEEAFDG